MRSLDSQTTKGTGLSITCVSNDGGMHVPKECTSLMEESTLKGRMVERVSTHVECFSWYGMIFSNLSLLILQLKPN